eukprot:CAMPEP_0168293968 /NCGR_PEP_ID=MMETSP0142_2-20121227/8311_1 /TAXON_ID=44445 /ORGANISM="Pseudo-nitzschia australis, Strain 10249 10 AB" /LENGTH=142 /DNA_ID=CAMNT_0008242183 /DNA_START=44 /DNA_END=472 /DNA_ORIENTATION=+
MCSRRTGLKVPAEAAREAELPKAPGALLELLLPFVLLLLGLLFPAAAWAAADLRTTWAARNFIAASSELVVGGAEGKGFEAGPGGGTCWCEIAAPCCGDCGGGGGDILEDLLSLASPASSLTFREDAVKPFGMGGVTLGELV